ncbi:MAG: hypothetical protein ACJ0O5_05180 [Flavobacteriaceae bacterium]|tara:strand:- start:782 stop:1255 length:474 start_codon:yes stop_codon:yes gene_type:complete
MKKTLLTLVLTFIIALYSCDLNSGKNISDSEFYQNELISMVYMKSNNKTQKEIDDFSDYYQKRMNELEPDVLSWKFFKSQNGQIILLERYMDEAAIFNHIENVSEGNPMEEDFKLFLDHFLVDSIEYYGKTSKEFKDTIEAFGFPISYKEVISGFSK